MLETFSQLLGFASAGVVALIALAFGAMFVFFAGSAAIILGHFVRFVRDPRIGLGAVAAAAALVAAVSLARGIDPWWALPLAQALLGALAWGVARARVLHRPLLWLGGGLLALAALGLVGAMVAPGLDVVAFPLLVAAGALLRAALIGFWPLVIGGLIAHRVERVFEWGISVRYLLARRRQTVISIISGICVVGVALGVAVITVVLSVMNGFSRMWEEKIIGARAHFSVHSRLGEYPDYRELRGRLLSLPGVEGATPTLEADAILRGDAGEIHSVILKGVDPETVAAATDLLETLQRGSLDDLDPPPGAEGTAALPGVILGESLADRFLLRIGDPLVLISPLGGRPTPLGPAPRMERFRVAGTFRSDFFQFDEGYVYTSLGGAQRFMKLDDVVSGIEVRTPDAYSSRRVAEVVERELGGLYYARDWKEFYPGFFQALRTERTMMFVLLSFIMVVAGFIIVATLIMMIMEKSRDISILKTMGCDDDAILRIFAIQGFLIGAVGLALGLGMGLVITVNLDVIQQVVEGLLGIDVLPANVYQLAGLPYDVDPGELAIISAIAMTLSVGATLLPSWQAARLDPAEGLRYE